MGRSKRRRGASADLISGLGDDVLVHILELLPDARDAVRTGALSRRWRGLWTRVSSLTFDSSSRRWKLKSVSSHKRFLDFVNSALAQRAMGDNADLEHLAISFEIMSPPVTGQTTNRLVRLSTEAAQGWIRHATQSTAKSFILKLWLLPSTWTWYDKYYHGRSIKEHRRLKQPTINLSDLPSSAKLETVHWDMKGVRLCLPKAAVFTSLMDLSLENIDLGVDSGHLLERLLSPACCPSLQKLQLRNLMLPLLNELLIEARALLKLSLSVSNGPIPGPVTLKLKTPSLRILHFEDYAYIRIRTLGISAPKLEELTFLPSQPDRIEVDGELPCVGNLKVKLTSHGYVDDDNIINDGGICLLRCCTSLTCLEVSLTTEEYGFTDIISGRIPHLPHLISLTVHAYLPDVHSFLVDLAEILKQCSYLKYLTVHCVQKAGCNHSLCNHPNQWKSHQIYLANIHPRSTVHEACRN